MDQDQGQMKLPDRAPVLRVISRFSDVNATDDVFGGRVATVAVNSFLFKQPISVGDVVGFYAERNPAQPVVVKVTEAQLTYVALNADGSKREVPTKAWRSPVQRTCASLPPCRRA